MTLLDERPRDRVAKRKSGGGGQTEVTESEVISAGGGVVGRGGVAAMATGHHGREVQSG